MVQNKHGASKIIDTFATYQTINSPGICSKMASNLGNKMCMVTCQTMFAPPCPAYFCLKFLEHSCKNSNLCSHFVKHLPKYTLASCKAHDGVMVHDIVTTKHHLETNLKLSFIHYSQTLVNRWFTKPSSVIQNCSKSFEAFTYGIYVSSTVHEK